MKNSISREYIYLIILSFVLLILVVVFSFLVLIPKGKEYRIQRNDLQKVDRLLRQEKDLATATMQKFKELQQSNRRIIKSFDAVFNPQRFEKENRKFFSKLSVKSVGLPYIEKSFAVYEVNTSSQINSPTSFYNFLDALNKSDWIIKVQFPIDFQREDKMINSSFKMQVYSNNRDTNASTSASDAK